MYSYIILVREGATYRCRCLVVDEFYLLAPLSSVCVCVRVCVRACVRACLRVCVRVCVHVCVCMYACMHACMYVCMHVKEQGIHIVYWSLSRDAMAKDYRRRRRRSSLIIGAPSE